MDASKESRARGENAAKVGRAGPGRTRRSKVSTTQGEGHAERSHQRLKRSVVAHGSHESLASIILSKICYLSVWPVVSSAAPMIVICRSTWARFPNSERMDSLG